LWCVCVCVCLCVCVLVSLAPFPRFGRGNFDFKNETEVLRGSQTAGTRGIHPPFKGWFWPALLLCSCGL
jgi:hypothetical protein